MIFVQRNDLNLNVKSQTPIEVSFRDKIVGTFKADLLVENKVIVELKAVSQMRKKHEAQLINYLKATEIELGLLMNLEKNQNLNDLFLVNEISSATDLYRF